MFPPPSNVEPPVPAASRFRLFVEMMPHLAWTAGADGRVDFCNRCWREYTGLFQTQTSSPVPEAVIHPDDLARCAAAWGKAIDSAGLYEVECRLKRASDAIYRWHFCQAWPMHDGERLVGWCGICTDIDDRKRAVDETMNLERFLESIVDNMPDAVFVKDATDLRFVRVNKAMQNLCGFTSAEAIGRSDYDFFPRDEADFFTGKDRAVLAAGKLLEILEEPMHTPAGTRFLHTKKIPIQDASGKPLYLLGIARDITRRKKAEEELREKNEQLEQAIGAQREAMLALQTAQAQLVQSAKLASLGQLVAGVAHEINNPLAFVTNNVVVLQRDFGELQGLINLYQAADATLAAADPQAARQIAEAVERLDLGYTMGNLAEVLARSRDGLKRIEQIVVDLRHFSRHDAAGDKPEDADLNAGIHSTANLIGGRARARGIELALDLAPLPPVRCHAAKINQVVLNLLANAVDACSAGGKVTARSRPVPGGVELQIADTGSGIAPDLLGKIFDPFFTTKPPGQGTGMGLSLSYGIISEHDGKITVDSEPGKGACFTVWLPTKTPEPRRS